MKDLMGGYLEHHLPVCQTKPNYECRPTSATDGNQWTGNQRTQPTADAYCTLLLRQNLHLPKADEIPHIWIDARGGPPHRVQYTHVKVATYPSVANRALEGNHPTMDVGSPACLPKRESKHNKRLHASSRVCQLLWTL